MDISQIIAKKRDGGEMSAEDITAAVEGFLHGQVSEGQLGALLMAIWLKGMTPRECADLTLAMVNSGERLDLSSIPGTKVDKHSTGGVGDKTTLVAAPLAAALGVPVPKMSGRALGHTGGTIDKLECIPGLTTDLSPERFCRQVADVGVAIAAQTETMAPADKKIYALRDATATVESVPLIASSIMSKKLAVGADAIVLDVKVGRGAFMPDLARATRLAEAMVEIGRLAGKRVVALITRMDQPLGEAVGDAVELAEAIATLAGRGPHDFVELCEIVAGQMLVLGGAAADLQEGRARARQAIASGAGLVKLRQMVAAQGGCLAVLDDPGLLTQETERAPVVLAQDGCVTGVDAREVGLAVRALKAAAGREQHACGVLLHRHAGDPTSGQPAATVLAPRKASEHLPQAAARVAAAFEVGNQPPPVPGLLADVVGS